jgi:methionyl-tRNA formyltransferase
MAAIGVQPVAAQGGQSSCQALYDDTSSFVEQWNDNTKQVPGFLRDRIAGRTIDVVVTRENGKDCHYTGVTNDAAEFTDVSNEQSDDATLKWETDAATVRRIVNADNPGESALEAFKKGDYKIKSTKNTGTVDRVALGAANAAAGIGRALGLL